MDLQRVVPKWELKFGISLRLVVVHPSRVKVKKVKYQGALFGQFQNIRSQSLHSTLYTIKCFSLSAGRMVKTVALMTSQPRGCRFESLSRYNSTVYLMGLRNTLKIFRQCEQNLSYYSLSLDYGGRVPHTPTFTVLKLRKYFMRNYAIINP